jgi:hypothetical protein
MCNGVACSKATGLTYCNVEWVNARVILSKTRLTLSGISPFQALTRSQVSAQISLVAQPTHCTFPTLRQARLHLDALWWTARAETSEREIYRRACHARSSRLASLPQASRSYAPVAPSCLNSLTPDAHRAGPLHPIAGKAPVSRCPSFPASTFG